MRGGAGTGKTVVAMHRAKHLADQIKNDPTRSGQRVLLTTFTTSLAHDIEANLRTLYPDHLDARPPEINRTVGSGAPLRRQTLQEQVESYLTSQWRPSAQDIDPARLIHLARAYLDQSGEGGE